MTVALAVRRTAAFLDRPAWGIALVPVAAWLAVMLAIPFLERAGGPSARTGAVVVAVALLATGVVLLLARRAGIAPALATAAVVVVAAWVAEAVGAATDLPFGAYGYTDALQPQLLGVPLLIPLAWLMLLPPAWAVAARIAGRTSGPAFVAWSAIAMTAWDLFLDPQMVAWGLWRWDEPGAYFGIPMLNFAGWLLVTAVVTLLARPGRLPLGPIRPLVLLYAATWLIETGGLIVFWGLVGPAIAGFLAMGAVVVLAWRRGGPWT